MRQYRHLIFIYIIVLLARIRCESLPISRAESIQPSSRQRRLTSIASSSVPPHITPYLLIHGGKKKTAKKAIDKQQQRSGPIKAITDALKEVYPATRVYLLAVLFCTIVHLTGAPAPALFALDSSKIYQLWRPFTSLSYLGPPSMSMATSLYFLVRYGQGLENENGTGAHVWFLLVQAVILTILGLLLRFPFQAHAMISATVYTSSHLYPMEKLPFQFGFVITSWQLPFCSMLIDILSQQTIAAAWPHVMGIFSGHVYHFFTKIWPELGGRALLAPPKFLVKKLGEKKSNIRGVDFSRKEEPKKTRRRASKDVKGRKLG